ncbi:hypothetical protein D6779_03060 [Candidatus Parcubacteria bacterium]|nr:MAG: hypothetical protein D6779_03060 [Candidatus Parcubacteria bacterium]
MNTRLKKQLLYLSPLLLILGIGIIVGASFLFRHEPTCFDGIKNQGEEDVDCGGPCELQCYLRGIQDIRLDSEIRAFYLAKDASAVLARIQNPNAAVAAPHFAYTLSIYDRAGSIVRRVTGDSFIYAGEVKYLFVPRVPIAANYVSKVDFHVDKVEWAPQEEFPRPAVEVKQFRTTKDARGTWVDGELVSEDVKTIAEIQVLAIFRGKFGQRTGASFTVVKNLAPRETRRFRIYYPVAGDIDEGATEVILAPLY